MGDRGYRLGIDFGTSNTVAVLRWPDGRSKPLLFDGSPLLPSAVYADTDGSILSGRDAVHSARLHPHRFEPYPKRRIEDGAVYLGDREIHAIDLVAAVLRRVATEVQRVAGAMPGRVTITHPAAWGAPRREALTRAAHAAGLPAPQLATEPVAAASYFVGTVGAHVPVGACAVVYDFGAGTFDASMVRRGVGGGFDVLANEGLSDAGGLDVDAAVMAYLGQLLSARAPQQWRRISQPESAPDRRAAWHLWEDVRLAKEMLSRANTAYVQVPHVDESVPLGREQLEQLARPILDRTVTATRLVANSAGAPANQLAAIFLVGGSSRIPLAATLLHRAFGIAPTAIEQPELVVAEGAVHLASQAGRAGVAPGRRGEAPGGTGPGGGAWAGPGRGGAGAGGVAGGTPSPVRPISAPPVAPPAGPIAPPAPTPTQPATRPQPATPAPAGQAFTKPSPAGSGTASPVTGGPTSGGPTSGGAGYGWPLPPTHGTYQMPGPTSSQVPPYSPAGPIVRPIFPAKAPPSRGPLLAAIVGGITLLLVVGGITTYALWPADDNPGGPGRPNAASPACGYKIAFMGILTGTGNGDGVPIRDSTKLAVEQYNAKHTGCTVELAEYDTQNPSTGKDDLAASRAQEIVADSRILGVIGPIYGEEVRPALPTLERAGLPMITPSATEDDLSQSASTVFHRVLGTDLDQAAAAVRHLTKVLKTSKTYVVTDGSSVGSTVADHVDFQLGAKSAGKSSIAGQSTDYSAVVKKIKDAGADSVYYGGFPQVGGAFVKQLRASQPSMVIVAGGRVFTDLLATTAGKTAVEGVYVTHASIPPTEARNGFADQFTTRFTRAAGYYGAEAFDATNIMLAGLAKGRTTRPEMLAWVKTHDADGTSRHIKFTARGDLAGPKLQIWSYKIIDGKFRSESVIPEN